jgi:hypothetical protein
MRGFADRDLSACESAIAARPNAHTARNRRMLLARERADLQA